MITPEEQVKVDAIKAKYKFKSPQQAATQPKTDWFTATAPKERLPFDLNNPETMTPENARATAVKNITETGKEIFEAGKAGVERIKQGFKQSNEAKNPLELVEGAIKMGEGGFQTITSPAAPVIKPTLEGIKKAGDALESTYGPEVERGLSEMETTPAERALEDVAGLSTIAGGVAGFKAPKAVAEKAGAATEKALDMTNKGVSKVKEVLPERPHPIDAIRGYVDTKAKASIQNDVSNLLKSTKQLAKKTEEAGARGTDYNKILSDPQVFKGLKVENGKINPDEAIKVVDDRIDAILTAKKGILPEVDKLVPKTPKQALEDRAIEYLRGKELPYDEVATIKRLQAQLDELPEFLTAVQIDKVRAMARASARNAKGQMKATSEYAALETAARDTVFDITDNLPVNNAAEYKALNDYVKQMISTKELLDGPLRSQTVKGGRFGSYSGRLVGAIAGSTQGPLGALAASYAGGVIADIITNNSLGSSFKMSLIKQMTDDPAIISQAQRLLQDIKQTQVPQLPPGKGNPSDVKNNVPIEMEQRVPDEGQAPNIGPRETIPKVEGAIPETSQIIENATKYQPEFEKAVTEIAKNGEWEVHHGPVKKQERANEKLTNEGGTLRDANRSTIVIKNPGQLAAVQEAVGQLFPEITRVKNKFSDPLYKSTIINVKTPLGHEAEIAVTTPNMWKAKTELGGQKLYKQLRSMDVGTKDYLELEKKMKELYSSAAEADSDSLRD